MMNAPHETVSAKNHDDFVRFMYLATHQRNSDLKLGEPLFEFMGEGLSKLARDKRKRVAKLAAEDLSKPCRNYQNGSAVLEDLMPWVRVIAQKIHRPLPSNILLNDLVQDGMIGLIMAFREFEAASGVPFHAFAENKIRWAIMDGLRAADWAGRSVRRRASQVSKTSDKLQAVLHRKPSKGEIAEELGVHVEDVATTLSDAYGCHFVRIGGGIDDEVQDIPDTRMDPAVLVERREAYSRAIASLRILLPKERKAFILRIMCEMSGQQAASEMGLGESRVSQLFKTATEKLAHYV
jgi:RNA polymerase sigma factor for flagellar operon FliA